MQSQINKSSARVRALALSAMFACLALIFSYVEAIIPFNAGIPGIKLGLANLVVIIALYEMNFRYALMINIIRIFVSGLLFSGMFGALYSLAGGLLSILVMWLLKKTGWFSMVGVSMAGGTAHNIGQLLVASAIVSNLRMFLYFPILMFSGIITGILIGITAAVIDQKLPKNLFR